MRDRLIATLAAAGVPVDRVPAVVGPGVVVTYAAGATQAQRDAGAALIAGFDWSAAAQAAWEQAGRRTDAAGLLAALSGNSILTRAVVGVLVDELNSLRDWITAFKAAVAAATSLANLQTRVAALANMPDRTLSQARDAVAAKINAGDADQ